MGRPTKLTPDLRDKIVAAVLGGNAAETAAEAYGVGESTFYEWMARGKSEEDGIYAEFQEAVTRSRAQAEMGAVDALRVGMLTDPKFAVEWLKRARHKRWEPSQQVEVRVGELDKLSDEEVAKRFNAAAERVVLALKAKGDE